MPITGIQQPEIIPIGDDLRLRKYDGVFDFALEWYQDIETVYLVDGVKEPYTMAKLRGMYGYLDKCGELYFIEITEGDGFRPIGDVCFWKEDMPIVIGDPACRSRHIGRRVITALVQRGRELGYDKLFVGEIYDWNTASRKCFEKSGFRAYEKTDKGSKYELELK